MDWLPIAVTLIVILLAKTFYDKYINRHISDPSDPSATSGLVVPP